MSVKLTEFAEETLVAAYRFIHAESPQNAEVVLKRIDDVIDLLGRQKYIGRKGAVAGTRRFRVPRTPFLLVYLVAEQDVIVVACLHVSQRWPHIPMP